MNNWKRYRNSMISFALVVAMVGSAISIVGASEDAVDTPVTADSVTEEEIMQQDIEVQSIEEPAEVESTEAVNAEVADVEAYSAVTSNDLAPNELTSSDVTPSDVTSSDVTPNEVTSSDVTPTDVLPSEVVSSEATSSEMTGQVADASGEKVPDAQVNPIENGNTQVSATPSIAGAVSESTNIEVEEITQEELSQEQLDNVESDSEEDAEEEVKVSFPYGIVNQGSDADLDLDAISLTDIMSGLKGMSVERQMVVLKAYSLIGQVRYFWGGKSNTIGWDERWGNMTYVFSSGSKTTGQLKTYGLDCSGYVSWVFNNACGEDLSGLTGASTKIQWANSTPLSWEDAQPGDIVFFHDPSESDSNHVGIIIGWTESGNFLIAHCSPSGQSGVKIAEASRTGFRYVRRPMAYDNEEFINGTGTTMANGEYYAAYQWSNSEEVDAQEVSLGDYAFKSSPSDVSWSTQMGIVIGKDISGKIKIAYETKDGMKIVGAEDEGYTSYRSSISQ